MTKKDFIRMLIKLTSIYLLISSLLPLLVPISMYFHENSNLVNPWGMILILVAIVAFFSWLIFFPDTLINLFKLDKGYEDDQIKTDQLKSENLISFAVIIIGGIFIVQSFIPLLVDICQRIQLGVQENRSFFTTFETYDNTRLYTCILELFVGCFLIFNFPKTARFLAKKNINNESE